VNENGSGAGSEYNHRLKASGLYLARPRYALFEHATGEVGRNQSSFGIPNRSVE
jgi:hypothetical protein